MSTDFNHGECVFKVTSHELSSYKHILNDNIFTVCIYYL